MRRKGMYEAIDELNHKLNHKPIYKVIHTLRVMLLMGLILWPGQPAAAVAGSSFQSCPTILSPNARFGFNFDRGDGSQVSEYAIDALQAHWYLDYDWRNAALPGVAYVRMIRTHQDPATLPSTVGPTVDANPGALWIVGNEPDRDTQDGHTPTAYAAFYHDVYTFLKGRDPTAQVAIAGVVQSTPLRRRYLDAVLDAYEEQFGVPLPVDVFTMHAFVLREDETWGAGIPPGLDAYAHEGMLYELQDHRDLEIFKQNIIDFRQWMADRGLRNLPLIVSEYGILMPPDYGFEYERVRDFMLGSFDFYLNETHAEIGYPADGNRLVQWWSWFSLNAPPYNFDTEEGFNGNLFDSADRRINQLGQDFADYVAAHPSSGIDLALRELQIAPTALVSGTATLPKRIAVAANVQNLGSSHAQDVSVRLWLEDAADALTLLDEAAVSSQVGAGQSVPMPTLYWTPQAVTPGVYTLWLEVTAENLALETDCASNRAVYTVTLVDGANRTPIYLPLITR